MAVRDMAVQNNHNPTLLFTVFLPFTIYSFHNECLSGPYLGKYKRDWNDRCQWEKVQCTRIITMPCILTVLSPFTI